MPATIPRVCPFCLQKKIVFTVVSEYISPEDESIYYTVVTCGNCSKPAVATFKKGVSVLSPLNYHGQFDTTRLSNYPTLKLLDFQPKYRPKIPPKHLPKNIHRAFQQANDTADIKQLTPAAMMTRKALELAIDTAFPDYKGSLFDKINKLGEQKHIPQAMMDWAHSIRLLGNAAAHNDMLDDECLEDRNNVKQALKFAEMFLTYTYTLPEEVRLIRAAKR